MSSVKSPSHFAYSDYSQSRVFPGEEGKAEEELEAVYLLLKFVKFRMWQGGGSKKSELFTRCYSYKSGLFEFTVKPGMSGDGKKAG